MSNSGSADAREEAGTDPLAVLAAAIKRVCVACIMWRMERSAIAVLHSMSDRELADFGLSRSDITDGLREDRAGDSLRSTARGHAGRSHPHGDAITSMHIFVQSY